MTIIDKRGIMAPSVGHIMHELVPLLLLEYRQYTVVPALYATNKKQQLQLNERKSAFEDPTLMDMDS